MEGMPDPAVAAALRNTGGAPSGIPHFPWGCPRTGRARGSGPTHRTVLPVLRRRARRDLRSPHARPALASPQKPTRAPPKTGKLLPHGVQLRGWTITTTRTPILGKDEFQK